MLKLTKFLLFNKNIDVSENNEMTINQHTRLHFFGKVYFLNIFEKQTEL